MEHVGTDLNGQTQLLLSDEDAVLDVCDANINDFRSRNRFSISKKRFLSEGNFLSSTVRLPSNSFPSGCTPDVNVLLVHGTLPL
jgi:hypothetical protein